MAKNINRITLLGNAGRDSETTYAPSGTAITKFSLATNRAWKVGEEWKSETSWHNIVVFGAAAERVNVAKGDTVYVDGRISYGEYEKDGVKIKTVDIIADTIISDINKRSDRVQKEEPATPSDDIDENLPF